MVLGYPTSYFDLTSIADIGCIYLLLHIHTTIKKCHAFCHAQNYETIEDRTAYKNRDRQYSKNRDSKENEVDLMMIYESLSFHIEHLSYNWSIITY